MSLFNTLNTADTAAQATAEIPADSITNIKVLEILGSLNQTDHSQIKELVSTLTTPPPPHDR